MTDCCALVLIPTFGNCSLLSLTQISKKNTNTLILIGPEGDFSEEEVAKAARHDFAPISLGESRLRTETAALIACHTIQVLNQM